MSGERDAATMVREHLADILDGSADAAVMEVVGESDAARDLLYDAERAVETAMDAAADYDADADRIEALVRDSLAEGSSDASGRDPAKASADAPASGVPPKSAPPPPEVEADRGDGRAPSPGDGESGPIDPDQQSRRRIAIAVLAATVLGLLFLWLQTSRRPAVADGGGWAGRAARISSAFGGGKGLERCSPDGHACSSLAPGAEVAAGSLLESDGHTRALVELADGSRLVMDRGARVRLETRHPRAIDVERGTVVLHVARDGSPDPVRITVAGGRAETADAKLAVDVAPDFSRVEVVRGRAVVTDEEGREVIAVAGEVVDLRAHGLHTSAAADFGRGLAWSELTFSADREEADASHVGLGELVAKKPGSQQELPGAVTLASHRVTVRISGGMARTEVEEVFQNQTGDVLEGILRFPLPAGAQIERLALETDGKLEEGAFVDRDQAAAIWRGAIANAAPKAPKPKEEIVWVPGPWRDPALLEWQRGGRFELRVFPIPKRGSRRIVLAYTERVPAAGEHRRYRLPLPHDPSGTAKLGRFAADVVVRDYDPSLGVRAVGYSMDARDESGVSRLTMHRDDFSPSGDLVVEYALPGRNRELTAWAYTPAPDERPRDAPTDALGVRPDAPFAVLALRPELPRWADGRPRSYAVVVDSSRSMIGERWDRARRLATTLTRELGRGDPVTVLACDVTCREAPGQGGGGVQRAAEVQAFLESITPEGGSDVAAGIEHGLARAAAGGGAARVVYVGDGMATVGPTQAAFLEHDVRGIVDRHGGSVTAVPLGGDADVAALEAVALAGRGVVVAHVPGRTVLDTAYAVLGATYGHALSDARVTLPEGLVDIAPARLPTMVAGSETFVVARMTGERATGNVTLTGTVGGKAFEQSYPLELVATTGKGNAFVPRLYAATQIAELERDGSKIARDRAVFLSSQYSLASRFTSLLVLESPAMFRAFGLDNTRRVATWTGEDDDDATAADGEVAYASEDVGLTDELSAFGAVGSGAASPSRSRKPAARRKSAPRDLALAPAPAGRAEAAATEEPETDVLDLVERRRPPPLPVPRRRMVPMRKVWERAGNFDGSRVTPSDADATAIIEAEREAQGDLKRDALARLYQLYFRAGRLDDAAKVAERWSTKDPLDPGALTARADVAAARGQRDLAIRILGSVVDVRPGDHKSQWRLARLHRWAGRPELGCRHSLAVSQIRPNDEKLLAEAVRCARDTGQSSLAQRLLAATDERARSATEKLLEQKATDPFALTGDLKVEATWEGGLDLDVSMVHPDGHRVSWLGAPTRAIISARDVLSGGREGLALRGAKPGEYVIEIARSAPGGGTVRGSLDVTVGNTRKTVPFTLEGDALRLGVAKVYMRSKLVPLGSRPI